MSASNINILSSHFKQKLVRRKIKVCKLRLKDTFWQIVGFLIHNKIQTHKIKKQVKVRWHWELDFGTSIITFLTGVVQKIIWHWILILNYFRMWYIRVQIFTWLDGENICTFSDTLSTKSKSSIGATSCSDSETSTSFDCGSKPSAVTVTLYSPGVRSRK